AVNVSYTWNSLSLLQEATDSRLGTTSYAYDPASNVATVTYPNGVRSTFTYDTLNHVTGLSSPSASYAYQRGPTGNLTSAVESSGRTVSWGYDGIYRLTGETISLAPSHNNGSASYGLDPVGNRRRVATVSEGRLDVLLTEGAPGPSPLGTGEGGLNFPVEPIRKCRILAVNERQAHPLPAHGGVSLSHLQLFPPARLFRGGRDKGPL
ncbi:MAG: hypothetical protein ABSD70_17050, partial [Terracidiphilus sp.]